MKTQNIWSYKNVFDIQIPEPLLKLVPDCPEGWLCKILSILSPDSAWQWEDWQCCWQLAQHFPGALKDKMFFNSWNRTNSFNKNKLILQPHAVRLNSATQGLLPCHHAVTCSQWHSTVASLWILFSNRTDMQSWGYSLWLTFQPMDTEISAYSQPSHSVYSAVVHTEAVKYRVVSYSASRSENSRNWPRATSPVGWGALFQACQWISREE